MKKINKNFLMGWIIFGYSINYGMETNTKNKETSILSHKLATPVKKNIQKSLGILKILSKRKNITNHSMDNVDDYKSLKKIRKSLILRGPSSKNHDAIIMEEKINNMDGCPSTQEKITGKQSTGSYKTSPSTQETITGKESTGLYKTNPSTQERISGKESREAHKTSQRKLREKKFQSKNDDKGIFGEKQNKLSGNLNKLNRSHKKNLSPGDQVGFKKNENFKEKNQASSQQLKKLNKLNGSKVNNSINKLFSPVKIFKIIKGNAPENFPPQERNFRKNFEFKYGITLNEKDKKFLDEFEELPHLNHRLTQSFMVMRSKFLEIFSPGENMEVFMDDFMDIIKNIFKEKKNQFNTKLNLFQCFTQKQSIEIQQTVKIIKRFFRKLEFKKFYNRFKNLLRGVLSNESIRKINDNHIKINRILFLEKIYKQTKLQKIIQNISILNTMDIHIIQEEIVKIHGNYNLNPTYQEFLDNLKNSTPELNVQNDMKKVWILMELFTDKIHLNNISMVKNLSQQINKLSQFFITQEDKDLIEYLIKIIEKIFQKDNNKRNDILYLFKCFTQKQSMAIQQLLEIIKSFFSHHKFKKIYKSIGYVLHVSFSDKNIAEINDSDAMIHRITFFQRINQKILTSKEIEIIKKQVLEIRGSYILNLKNQILLSPESKKSSPLNWSEENLESNITNALIVMESFTSEINPKNLSITQQLCQQTNKLSQFFITQEDKILIGKLVEITQKIFQGIDHERNDILYLLGCFDKNQSIAIKQILEIIRSFISKKFKNIYTKFSKILCNELSDSNIAKIKDEDVMGYKMKFLKKIHDSQRKTTKIIPIQKKQQKFNKNNFTKLLTASDSNQSLMNTSTIINALDNLENLDELRGFTVNEIFTPEVSQRHGSLLDNDDTLDQYRLISFNQQISPEVSQRHRSLDNNDTLDQYRLIFFNQQISPEVGQSDESLDNDDNVDQYPSFTPILTPDFNTKDGSLLEADYKSSDKNFTDQDHLKPINLNQIFTRNLGEAYQSLLDERQPQDYNGNNDTMDSEFFGHNLLQKTNRNLPQYEQEYTVLDENDF
jgi:hypothetical protein